MLGLRRAIKHYTVNAVVGTIYRVPNLQNVVKKVSVCQEDAKHAISKLLQTLMYPQARKRSSAACRVNIFIKV